MSKILKNSQKIRTKEAEIFASLLTEEGKRALLTVLFEGPRDETSERRTQKKTSAGRDASLSRARVRARTRGTRQND